jgi:hypothetical protein
MVIDHEKHETHESRRHENEAGQKNLGRKDSNHAGSGEGLETDTDVTASEDRYRTRTETA